MKFKLIVTSIAMLFSSVAFGQYVDFTPEQAEALNSEAGRNIAKYNPSHADLGVSGKEGLGLSGNDPVSFYSDEGPVLGSSQIQVRHQGVIYHFSSEENKAIFLDNPNKYEPTYGGWCAFAMVSGSPVPINTNFYSFVFNERGERVRINFFVNAAAMGSYHGYGRRDRKTSLEILADMQNGVTSVLKAAADNQAKADANWLLPAHGNEEPRVSNGRN